MANQLKELKVREVSLVDRPANFETVDGKKIPRAVVAIWKRDVEDVDLSKYSPDQDRDDHGRFGGGGGESDTYKTPKLLTPAQVATGSPRQQAANALTNRAHQMSIDASHHSYHADPHEEAADLQRRAEGAHRAIATSAKGAGAIAYHTAQAKEHANYAAYHERRMDSIGSNKMDKAEDPLWKAADGQMVDGKVFPRSDFAYTPSDNTSEWKLRLASTPGGAPDSGIVGAAAAALGAGFRGQKVSIPASARAAVVDRVRAAWHKANPDRKDEDMPDGIKKGEEDMTMEELQQRLTKTEEEQTIIKAESAILKTDNALLKAENDAVLKMTKTERKAYAMMDSEKRKEYMAGDAEKRKEMMEACDKAAKKKAKPFDDSADDGEPEPDEDDMDKKKKADVDKADKPDNVLVMKAADLETRLMKAETLLKATQVEKRLNNFINIAKNELKNTSGSDVDKGDMLMKMADALGEESDAFKKYYATLREADKAMTVMYREVGKGGGGPLPAEKVLEAKAQEIAKRDNINLGAAIAKAGEENPDLWIEMDLQHRRAAMPA